MVGLLAGVCLSANAPTEGKEIAMSKCSKDTSNSSCNGKSDCNSPKDKKSSCNGKSGCDGSTSSSDCGSSSDQAEVESAMKAKRKAAAQKIVQAE